MNLLEDVRIQIYADNGDLAALVAEASKPWVAGLTTNPSLMRWCRSLSRVCTRAGCGGAGQARVA